MSGMRLNDPLYYRDVRKMPDKGGVMVASGDTIGVTVVGFS